MSSALGLLGVTMFNPLSDLLNTLAFYVPNRIVGVREAFNSHSCAILSEEQADHHEGSPMISSGECMQPDQILHQLRGLTLDA